MPRTIRPGRQADANASGSPGEVYSETYSRDNKLTRTHLVAQARYTANDTSGTTGESRNENTDAGDAPTLSTLNLFYEKQ